MATQNQLQQKTAPLETIVQPPKTVDFYVDRNYLEPTQDNKGKPWAPYKVPVPALNALAKSEAYALHKGLIQPDTAKYYLASALKEGRWNDYGVNEVLVNNKTAPTPEFEQVQKRRNELVQQNKSKLNPKTLEIYNKYGYVNPNLVPGMDRLNQLYQDEQVWPTEKVPKPVEQLRQAMTALGFRNRDTDVRPAEGGGFVKSDMYRPAYPYKDKTELEYREDALDYNANLKTAALLNKVKEKGVSGLEAWKRYNGGGKAAEEYKNKVNEIHTNLDHPKNKDSAKAYRNIVNKYLEEFKRGESKK